MEKQLALVRTFYDDGFLKIPSFFNAAELAEIEKNLGRFVRELIPSLAPAEVFYEDKNLSGSLKQIQRMHEHDSFFFNLFHVKFIFLYKIHQRLYLIFHQYHIFQLFLKYFLAIP